ncbi:protein phosphatase 2C domain-containing protein [Streptomyces sp. ISL-10]|uniref:PP2C family serine/threonine-protein phosphatase n=1 Tax=Streptomyces sp. ISL-10 TaxID=2819172 RepID=UPI001BE94DD4|nr:PP2C family serine/threonine-protein phosphatase [Streptomyces sp. ISL-10]MBT2368422.1 protein phosphatase 2C domain-containing protein [Streptomyces sp. ISL-10]
MAQMHQPADDPACPGCEEPVEPGDRFCGACGYDLSAVPAPSPDRPTLAIGTPVEWPAATVTDTSGMSPRTQQPGDLPGTDSDGDELSHHGVRYDTPPSGDFELAAPDPAGVAPDTVGAAPDPVRAAPADPRAAEPLAAPTRGPSGGRLCVACRAGHVDPDGYCENCGHAQPRERDHMEQELGSVAAVSDRGLRHHRNEDAFAVSATSLPDGSPAVVAVVCDGVSSATRPDEASSAAARAANEELLAALPRGTHPQQAMHEAIVAAATAVNSLVDGGASGDGSEPDQGHRQNAPACTIVSAVAAGGLLVVGWVGDSRAYWVPDDRSGPPARLTEDDSWAAQMVAAGLMNEAEAYADERAHAITGWLGADAYELEPHTASFKPDRSGVVVVCTDGLWNYAEGADEMARAVPPDAAERPLHSAQVLVGHALDGGGHDNVTVAVLPFAVRGEGAGPA